ncbi:MAG: hypothetical protein AAF928_13500 [Myxococcota bacterium]
MPDEAPRAAAPPLACLAGQPPPPPVARDFQALAGLPEGARDDIWRVLEPCLAPTVGEEADRAVEQFARAHRAVGQQVAEAVRGLRFLLFEAAGAGAEKHAFAADLGALMGEAAGPWREVLLPRYETTRDGLRAQIVRQTVVDHGRLMVGLDWRIDRILGSQHGRDIQANVALLTFTYREGDTQKRMTLHAEPAMMMRLRHVCEQLVPPAPVEGGGERSS